MRVGYERLHPKGISVLTVARLGASDPAIIFYADKEPAHAVTGTICQADHCINKVCIRQPPLRFTLKFYRQAFPACDEFAVIFQESCWLSIWSFFFP